MSQPAGGSGRRRKGNEHLQSTLVECAWAAVRHDGYLSVGYFTRGLDPERETRRLIARLEALGHRVTLQETAA